MDSKLRDNIISFLDEIEALAKDAGYQEAKKEYEDKLAEIQYKYDRLIVETREQYYNEGFSDGRQSCTEESKQNT